MRWSGSSSLLLGILLAGGVAVWLGPTAAWARADTGCAAVGYRVVATRWDAVLGRSWQLREECAHPEWPARWVAGSARTAGPGVSSGARNGAIRTKAVAPPEKPLLVHAGGPVTLWMQDAIERVEMSGVAEQSAHIGEHVMVQVSRQNDEQGRTIERFAGTVSGPGDVEMDQ